MASSSPGAWTITADALRAPVRRLGGLVAALPGGDSRSGASWRSCHAWICGLLWLHVLLVPAYGILSGQLVGHSLLEGAVPVAGLALAASSRRFADSRRSLAATLGLVISSAVLVHFSGGLIEMHFHFLVVVLVVSLYQSWRPLLLALGVILLHHGIAGMIAPASVYNHPSALARPWLWALIHAGFVLAASATCLVSWRLNEHALEGVRRAHRELAAAQRVAAVGSWEWVPSTDDLTWSAEMYRLLRVGPDAGPTIDTFVGRVHPEDRPRVAALVAALADAPADVDFECRILLPDGTTRTVHVRGTHVDGHPGLPSRMRGTCQDITERKALEREIEYRAFYDGLTGLANRSLFMDRLEHALAARRRTNAGGAVLYLDLDGFKDVNDRHGHHVGDQLLVEAARRLRRCVRGSDTLARLGGDEFAVLLSGVELTDARKVADRMQRELAAPLLLGDERHRIAASIGICEFTEQHGPDDLLREADAAMYAAKDAGKGRYEVYAPGIERAVTTTLPGVVAVEAMAWADYIRRLRLEIAARKLTGDIPSRSRAPEGVHRTLERMLAAIDRLPADASHAALVLPALKDVEEFVYHGTAVQHWADALVAQGTLATDRTPEADRFWQHLERQVLLTACPAAPGRR